MIHGNERSHPESGADLIFTCIAYHHIENRVAYFQNVA